MKQAYRVISNLELLYWNTAFFRDISQQERGLRIRGVSLIRVRLDDNTAVDPRRMVRFVAIGVVRVDLTVSPFDRQGHRPTA